MTRIKGLDGIRMLAVSAVLIAHFWEGAPSVRDWHLGHFGVMLFFILSGFLISSIILAKKSQGLQLGNFLKQFYIRRTLRIFPLFYLSILVFSIFGKGFGDYLVWHLSYASNFLLVKNGSGFLGAHFWSLAVEEQFYLIFPVLLFLCKPRWESALVGTLICIGVISRIAFWNFDAPYPYLDRLLTTNLDSLGLGAALALGKMRGQSNRIMLLISGLSLIVAVLFGNDATVMHFILLPVFSIVIALIDRNQDTLLIRALELQPLRYIGTISYGLYVWHYLLWQNRSEFEYFYQVLNSIHPILQYGHSERLVIGTLSLVISIVSWELFEKKILALKNRFSYS